MTSCPTQNLFSALIYRRSSHYLTLGIRTNNAIYNEMVNFLLLHIANNYKATGGTVKSTLKIPPRHNGVVPIKISGPLITRHTAHFITDGSTPKGRDPNINIIDGIHQIKDRTSVNILVSNYTNKHLTFHKGKYIGHLEPIVLNPQIKEIPITLMVSH